MINYSKSTTHDDKEAIEEKRKEDENKREKRNEEENKRKIGTRNIMKEKRNEE